MRVYSDASHDEDVIGIAYVLRDERLDVDESGRRYIEGEFTSMEAEYIALMTGVRMASHYTNEVLIALTDCRPLMYKLLQRDGNSDKWDQFFWQARAMLESFDEWQINHIERANNQEADALARAALHRGRGD